MEIFVIQGRIASRAADLSALEVVEAVLNVTSGKEQKVLES